MQKSKFIFGNICNIFINVFRSQKRIEKQIYLQNLRTLQFKNDKVKEKYNKAKLVHYSTRYNAVVRLRPGRWYQFRIAAIGVNGFRGYSELSRNFQLKERKAISKEYPQNGKIFFPFRKQAQRTRFHRREISLKLFHPAAAAAAMVKCTQKCLGSSHVTITSLNDTKFHGLCI